MEHRIKEVTLREFLLECIRTPNKKTLKAMDDGRKEKTKKAKNFEDLCEQLGIEYEIESEWGCVNGP